MLEVRISSWRLREIAKKNPENFELLRQFQPSLDPVEKYAEDKSYSDFNRYVNEIELLPEWMFEVMEVKPIKPLNILKPDGGISPNDLRELLGKFQVHLPGNELLRVSEVVVHENCCTEALQKELDDGWRIITVCPQAGQRRPDYILGRSSPRPPGDEGPF